MHPCDSIALYVMLQFTKQQILKYCSYVQSQKCRTLCDFKILSFSQSSGRSCSVKRCILKRCIESNLCQPCRYHFTVCVLLLDPERERERVDESFPYTFLLSNRHIIHPSTLSCSLSQFHCFSLTPFSNKNHSHLSPSNY